ncbi:hypothetical protein J2S40_001169 [Nocardioides luteus]|uniref:Uncharacterized protein n=1 Tax=Nocardioides luteus TaxID=1844 RepID=A0ABQ5ST74_9ACTN|nr:hypothetical protein [Nocardioides luteus]MDR7310111.1 hypothetical protein [Nocardioides luteus]GGR64719.1 hypothetical protein GCM10010197_35200 [Nocardioides luteus]GLJ66981.1 hypothetical protein GCM10017579_10170 [Nocardioides luteus]
MDQKAARTAASKAFKAGGMPLRKGHHRLGDPKKDDIVWYVDLRAKGAGPTAPLLFEIGCWVAALGHPEPEGGAVDCPLLLDRRVAATTPAEMTDEVGELVALVGDLDSVGTLREALADGRLGRPLVDQSLRSHLDG